MRCFVAVDLPDDVKAALSEAQKQLLQSQAKLSPAHDFHLTLKFLGEITPAKVEIVKNCLSSVKFKPFAAAVAGIGVFPSESYIRVVWAGVGPEDDFIRLQKFVDDALEKEFPKDKNFKPHLTLARVKFVADKEHFIQQLQQIQLKKTGFSVKEFKLKKSALSNKGAVYEDLAVYAGNRKDF